MSTLRQTNLATQFAIDRSEKEQLLNGGTSVRQRYASIVMENIYQHNQQNLKRQWDMNYGPKMNKYWISVIFALMRYRTRELSVPFNFCPFHPLVHGLIQNLANYITGYVCNEIGGWANSKLSESVLDLYRGKMRLGEFKAVYSMSDLQNSLHYLQ